MKEKIEEAYIKFSKALLYFILKHVSNKSTAEDLLHEVFIKAYNNIENIKEDENIQAWLYKIARNTIIDYYRNKQITTTQNYELYFEEEQEESVLSELSCCLSTLLKDLPLKQQEVLNEVYLKEKSLVEYAKEKNLNLSSVKSTSKRAKEKLKKILNDCCKFQENARHEIVDYSYNKKDCICKTQ
ncbi:MAG: hypothetical protein COA66_05285 [Arcobacter sp.]|nr:MAG: hypothetical protein COA66_05285 [Arcobacter sp.]